MPRPDWIDANAKPITIEEYVLASQAYIATHEAEWKSELAFIETNRAGIEDGTITLLDDGTIIVTAYLNGVLCGT